MNFSAKNPCLRQYQNVTNNTSTHVKYQLLAYVKRNLKQNEKSIIIIDVCLFSNIMC
jgi:hypothetical protein